MIGPKLLNRQVGGSESSRWINELCLFKGRTSLCISWSDTARAVALDHKKVLVCHRELLGERGDFDSCL